MRDIGQFDWDDLRLLIGIADAGSMTGAASHLGVSQPTLGRRLKALEGRLGASLFDRLPNCLELTAFGSQVRCRNTESYSDRYKASPVAAGMG